MLTLQPNLQSCQKWKKSLKYIYPKKKNLFPLNFVKDCLYKIRCPYTIKDFYLLNKILCQNKPFTFEKMSLNKYLNYVYLSRYILLYIFVDFKEQQASFYTKLLNEQTFPYFKKFIKIFFVYCAVYGRVRWTNKLFLRILCL